MQLIVNGEKRQLSAATVAELIGALSLASGQVAVERNGAIVPRSRHGEVCLAEGDRIEIVQFIGGG